MLDKDLVLMEDYVDTLTDVEKKAYFNHINCKDYTDYIFHIETMFLKENGGRKIFKMINKQLTDEEKKFLINKLIDKQISEKTKEIQKQIGINI